MSFPMLIGLLLISIGSINLITFYVLQVLDTKQTIRDQDGSAYLVRYFIWKPKNKNWGRIYLHHILRSDHDRAAHNHPWPYKSLILKGQYREYTTAKNVVDSVDVAKPNPQEWKFSSWPVDRETVYADFQAGQYLKRPATWKHRLEIEEGKTVWTLVFIGPKVQEWGFFPHGVFCHWTKYDTHTGLCEE